MCGKHLPRVLQACPMSTTATRNILWILKSQTGISKWCLTGTAPDGKKVEVQGCDFYTFRAGEVVRKDSYWKLVESN